MPRKFATSAHTRLECYGGQHRFEHWYRDNTVYFITARCRDRFTFHTKDFEFIPWITTLIPNHYHTLGYLRDGKRLGQMMQRIHGSVAKLVNDVLPERRKPFWRASNGRDYFDGCLRDELQCGRAYWYTLTQARRHGLCADYTKYPHTRIAIDLDRGVKRALQLNAFMGNVRYPRYERGDGNVPR